MANKQGVPPAEASERDALARAALAERADELAAGVDHATGAGKAGPPVVGLEVRDVKRDQDSLAAIVEVFVQSAARLLAWRAPACSIMAAVVCNEAQSFAAEAGEKFGAALGQKLPKALPYVGGVCGMLAWGFRKMPLPRPPELPAQISKDTPGAQQSPAQQEPSAAERGNWA